MDKHQESKITDEIQFLRRHARALVGNQLQGDDFALRTLEAILSQSGSSVDSRHIKFELFKTFYQMWSNADAVTVAKDAGPLGDAIARIAQLPKNSREALLLHTVEKFSVKDTALLLGISPPDVESLIKAAHEDLRQNLAGRVMIIEDEQLIAKDLATLVTGLGHTVTGTVATFEDAIALAKADLPDLVLADIQIASKETGIEAVRALIDAHGQLPVVFITAFPELLLTGERKEPAFLIAKPYQETEVQSAISQAMFFRSTAEI